MEMQLNNFTIADVGINTFTPPDEHSGDIPPSSSDRILESVVDSLVDIVVRKPENWDVLVTNEILKLESIQQ